MAALLFSWFYIFWVSFSLGLIFYHYWRRWHPAHHPYWPPAYVLSLTGLCLLNGLISFLSLWLPLNWWGHVFLILLAAGYGVFNHRIYHFYLRAGWRQFKRNYRGWCIWGTLLLLYLVYLGTTVPTNDDSGIYHVQSIKWAEHYKAIPGLGNLAGRLAFNSSYFLWSALFSFSSLAPQPVYALNSYLLLLLGVVTLGFLFRQIRFPAALPTGLFLAALFYLNLYYFSGWVSSPTPDIAAAVLVTFIFWLLLQPVARANPAPHHFRVAALILLLSTCLTVKLSVAPALVFIWYRGYDGYRQLHGRWALVVAGGFIWIILPWLVRNVILSGYLLYPFPALDLFNFDWEVPRQLVQNEKDMVHSVAILLAADWPGVLALEWQEWIPRWFQDHTREEQVLLGLALGSPGLMAAVWYGLAGHPKVLYLKKTFGLWLVNYGCVWFWFVQAPSLRFGTTFLIISAGFPFFLGLATLKLSHIRLIYRLVLVMAAGWWLNGLRPAVYVARYQPQTFTSRLRLPARPPQVYYQKIFLNQHPVYLPQQGFMCWDAPLPCTYALPRRLEWRGKEITAGFRMKSLEKP